MKCTIEAGALVGALMLAAFPYHTRADSPPAGVPDNGPGDGRKIGAAQDDPNPEGADKSDPLTEEHTKRFMRFGKIPERFRDDGAPKVGEVAPPLKLKTLDGREEVDLASFRGKKPVVLIFGSYT